MTKLDVNGNTVSRNRRYILAVLAQTSGKAELDGYGRAMLPMPNGGMVVFFMADEPGITAMLCAQGRI